MWRQLPIRPPHRPNISWSRGDRLFKPMLRPNISKGERLFNPRLRLHMIIALAQKLVHNSAIGYKRFQKGIALRYTCGINGIRVNSEPPTISSKFNLTSYKLMGSLPHAPSCTAAGAVTGLGFAQPFGAVSTSPFWWPCWGQPLVGSLQALRCLQKAKVETVTNLL